MLSTNAIECTNAPLLRDFTWYRSSFVPGHHLTFLRAAPRRMMCCTTSVSGSQCRLLLTSPRRLMQVYLTLPLTGKQPHDLPPLRNAFVCPYAALATCISTGDLRLEIACVACVDPALHDAWTGYMVVPPCSTSRSQSYSQSFGKNARQRIAPGFGLLLHGMSHSGPYTAAHSINAAGKVALDGPYCWTCGPRCLVVGVLSGVRCCFMSFLNRLIVERYHISTPPSSNTDLLSSMLS